MNHSLAALLRWFTAFVLLAFPLLLIIGFALHFRSFGQFWDFRLRYEPATAESVYRLLRGSEPSRFALAHWFAYSAVPLLMLSGLSLAYLLYPVRPGWAVAGGVSCLVGSLFMSGVFAAWLSFTAVSNVPAEFDNETIAVLGELIRMQGALLIITRLSYLSLFGLALLALGFWQTNLIPRWASGCLLIGSLLIAVFMDLDNWMLIGAILLLTGLVPVARKLIHAQDLNGQAQSNKTNDD
ncbi:hypothetical protein [Spirosoma arcticum]